MAKATFKGKTGFAAVKAQARASGAKNPGGVAYSVGVKKYGKKGMAAKAAAGKKK
jgi:hypothetical protein